MKKGAIGNNLHKIQQKKVELILNVNIFHPVLNTADL